MAKRLTYEWEREVEKKRRRKNSQKKKIRNILLKKIAAYSREDKFALKNISRPHSKTKNIRSDFSEGEKTSIIQPPTAGSANQKKGDSATQGKTAFRNARRERPRAFTARTESRTYRVRRRRGEGCRGEEIESPRRLLCPAHNFRLARNQPSNPPPYNPTRNPLNNPPRIRRAMRPRENV